MSKKILLLIALVVSVFFLVFAINGKKADRLEDNPQAMEQESPVRKNYLEYCASCHGDDLGRFTNRSWVFGGSVDEMAMSIKLGRPSIGMPDFGKALSDQEIRDLAEYILEELPHYNRREEQYTSIEDTIHGEEFSFVLETVADDFGIPWGMTWLPDGRMLVADKQGILYLYSGDQRISLKGVPEVMDRGQGGLMDVELHPDYEENGWIYLAYSKPAENAGEGGGTAIMRARLDNDRLTGQEVIFEAMPPSTRGLHFGCRMEFDKDNYLFFTVGERGRQENAQDLANHNGKVHRIHDDGRIPADNPFVDNSAAMASIYSYGHRNPQGLAIDKNGIIWEHEHGPKGGDELNIVKKGKNYGWPEITFGINYDGTIITTDTAKAGMEQPVYYWIPSIAPCGMDIIEGGRYPGWEGNIVVGALSFQLIERMVIEENKVVHRERLLENLGRVRNVKTGPEGYLYVAVENPNRIVKLIPITP